MMRKTSLAGKLYIILMLVLLYLPTIVVAVYSLNSNESRSSFAMTGISLRNYARLFTGGDGLLPSLWLSLRLALYACGLSLVLGTLGAVGMVKRRFRGMGALENAVTLPIMIPEIILGMAFMALFGTISMKNGMATLVIAHTTFCVPYIYIIVKGRLQELDPALLEAARDLGASQRRAFFDVTLPLVAPALVSGTLMAFAMSMDDFVISFFVSGATTTTLPLRVYSSVKVGVPLTVNALSTLMLVTVFLLAGLRIVFRRGRPKRRRPAHEA